MDIIEYVSISFEERIKKLNQMIQRSKHIVFFGGAGVSTESGIPDFRSKDGLYNQHDIKFDEYEPEYLLSHSCLHNNCKVFFEFYRQKMDCRNIKPNIAHIKLAELEEKGKLTAIITQNIDGLHQKAGCKNVFEIHGTTKRIYCNKCGAKYDSDWIFTCKDAIPKCECGGIIRPDVTLYGESVQNLAWRNAMDALHKSDLLIVGGTSLTVYPAANLISEYYRENLVIINRDITGHDNYADLIFREDIGKVFNQIQVQ